VHLNLPIATNPQLSGSSGPRLHPGLKKMNLLLLDNDTRLRDIISSLGLTVTSTSVPEEAIRFTQENAYDIILLAAELCPLDEVLSPF
jgi:hypothetical protein